MQSHPMMYYVILGLQKRLAQRLSIDAPQLKLSNDPYSQLLALGGGARTDNIAIPYPITYIRPTTVGVDEESYRAAFTAKKGFAARFGLQGNASTSVPMFNFTPVVIPFEFGYITDDPMKFLEFTSDWVHESNTGGCNYKVKYKGTSFDIRVKLDPQFEVPEREGGADAQQQAMATSVITVHAFVPGRIDEIDRRLLNPELVFDSVSLLPQKTKLKVR